MRLRRREERVAWLRRVPLFADLSTAQLEAIMPLVEEVDAEPDRVLIQQGEYGRELMLVIEGGARVTRDGEYLRDLAPGDVVGEIALLDGGLRTATVTVSEPTTLLTISKRAFDAVLDQVPGLSHELLRALATRLREATDLGSVSWEPPGGGAPSDTG